MPKRDQDWLTFEPTSGRVLGWLLVVGSVIGAALAILSGRGSWGATSAALLVAVLAWAAMLRPALSVSAEHLVMRNMVETVTVPLAAIERLAVSQVLAVRVGGRRLVSPVVGRAFGKALVASHHGIPRDVFLDAPVAGSDVDYVDYVEDEIRRRMDRARTAAGVGLLSEEQEALADDVRRQPAWLAIVLISVAALSVVLAIVL